MYYFVHNAQTYQNDNVSNEKIKIDNLFTLDTSTSRVEKLLGVPYAKTTTYDEILETNLSTWHYSDLKLLFYKNELLDFIFMNETHRLYVRNVPIRVGMSFSELKSKFPKSYANKKNGIAIVITERDEYLSVDEKNGIVIKIRNLRLP